MSGRFDRLGKVLFLAAIASAWFILGCGVKQVTTEVRDDGSGRNIFVLVRLVDQDPESAADQQEAIEESRAKAESCGAESLPYSDGKYTGYQIIMNFETFSEVPGQISCWLGDTVSLSIDGSYQETSDKKTYRVQTRIRPFNLWGLADSDPMLYRIITPGEVVAYSDVQTDRVHTVQDTTNRISWYFQRLTDDDTDLEYWVTLEAARVIRVPTVPPPTVTPAITVVAPTATTAPRRTRAPTTVPPPTAHPPTAAPTSRPPATATPTPDRGDLMLYSAILGLVAVAMVAGGTLTWTLMRGAAAGSARPEPAPPHTRTSHRSHEQKTRTGERRTREAGHQYNTPHRHTPPRDYPTPGMTLDKYLIREELGHGGMAVVYRAWHDTLQRQVALKVLAPQLTRTPDFVTRFQREGHILARLSHANIVSVYDAGTDQGFYFLVMELIQGQSLDRALKRRGQFKPKHVVSIALQVGKALDYAHTNGVIHRDIKPGNILLDEKGWAKVADFGVVAILGEQQVAHTRIGTPSYMAYEHFKGSAVPQSDIYSLGVCMYEMLTGRLPPAFGLEAPAPPSALNRAVSPRLEYVVLKCLRPDPNRRFATARELRAALKQTT
ncbi:MAG: serine/threonine protein kinase [Anaerolineae bacterium]|nr:serine/threonine protein kinase [Anaerolineae bacterium]